MNCNNQSDIYTAQQCNCGVCGSSNTLPNMYRRYAMFGLLAGLLLTQICPAKADDDLLDPSKIGVTRKSMSDEGLLDPTRKIAKASPSTATSTRSGNNQQQVNSARSMAESVVGSLDSLTHAAVNLIDELLKLDERASSLSSNLQTLQEDMIRKMGEYRSGLFCSGCNHTKSEILAKGETFPHPGQRIIRPTPEQIAAKERELQAPIDRIERELRDNRTKRIKVANDRDEALLQIGYGLNLWRTSISFENALIWQGENESIATYKTASRKIDDQTHKLTVEILIAKDKAKVDELSREKEMWTITQDKLDGQRMSDRRNNQNALSNAASKVSNEQSELQGYLGRGKLSQFINAVANASFTSSAAGFDELGGKYRMGSYNFANHDEVLSNVNSFVTDFRNIPQLETIGTKSGKSAAPDGSLIPKAKGKLKELLNCKPEAGEQCTPSKKVGSTLG